MLIKRVAPHWHARGRTGQLRPRLLRRARTTWRWLSAALFAASLGGVTSAQAQSADPSPFYLRAGGSFYHYVRENSTTFSSISERIKQGYYAARGIKVLTIYCPYKATDEWRGVPAIDFFSTNPNTGTIDDFEEMTSTAHAHGMSVIMYVSLLFVAEENPIWIKGDKDHADGVNSMEAGLFRFANQASGNAPEFGSWRQSEHDGYYAASWDLPAIDIGREPGRKYVESVLKFWLDRGVDGFEYDAPGGFWGGTPSLLKQLLVDIPQNYDKANPKYLIGEGSYAGYQNEDTNDAVGFTHVLLSGDDDENSVASEVWSGERSVDSLESHFASYIDPRRAAGRGVRSVSLYDMGLTPAQRALEAAVLAGNGSYMEIDYDVVYSKMSAEHQRQYDAVFKALASSAAEAPGAARKRLSTSAGKSAAEYAVLRTSPSGMERAVNVYNFRNTAATIVVNLSGSGIADGSVAFNLVTQTEADKVSGQQYTVQLPALGYALLRFGKEPLPVTGPSLPDDAGSPDPNGGADGGTGGVPDPSGNEGDGTNPPPGGPGAPTADGGPDGQPHAPSVPRGTKVRGRTCSTLPGAPDLPGATGVVAVLLAAGLVTRRRSRGAKIR